MIQATNQASSRQLFLSLLLALGVCLVRNTLAASIAADQHAQCPEWAEVGECDTNPTYMLASCATSCDKVMAVDASDASDLHGINSFYELSAPDIDGNMVDFNEFQGKVVILTNVASYCGYTEGHYKQLVELWSHFPAGDNVEILAFPCNQFGQQEPGTADEIKAFIQQKGVTFRIMSKTDVNGPQADKVYKFLKREAGPNSITWNFATYFVVSPNGDVTSYSGVEPSALKTVALSLLKEEL